MVPGIARMGRAWTRCFCTNQDARQGARTVRSDGAHSAWGLRDGIAAVALPAAKERGQLGSSIEDEVCLELKRVLVAVWSRTKSLCRLM